MTLTDQSKPGTPIIVTQSKALGLDASSANLLEKHSVLALLISIISCSLSCLLLWE